MNGLSNPGGVSRRSTLIALPVLATSWLDLIVSGASGAEDRFDYLSANGNSNCSTRFMQSIATMPDDMRLQGSCCSSMDRGRYSSQVRGLERYATIAEIPPDPYDIAAGLANRLMARYDDVLNTPEQLVYQYAMGHSREQGPCCCQCWRWRLYGGLAKVLIRQRGFTGEQIVDVWDLSDGCGGS